MSGNWAKMPVFPKQAQLAKFLLYVLTEAIKRTILYLCPIYQILYGFKSLSNGLVPIFSPPKYTQWVKWMKKINKPHQKIGRTLLGSIMQRFHCQNDITKHLFFSISHSTNHPFSNHQITGRLLKPSPSHLSTSIVHFTIAYKGIPTKVHGILPHLHSSDVHFLNVSNKSFLTKLAVSKSLEGSHTIRLRWDMHYIWCHIWSFHKTFVRYKSKSYMHGYICKMEQDALDFCTGNGKSSCLAGQM